MTIFKKVTLPISDSLAYMYASLSFFKKEKLNEFVSSDDENFAEDGELKPANAFTGNLVSSRHKSSCELLQYDEYHYPILDLDFECELVPSSTPGHHHLYMAKLLPKKDMEKLVNVLAEVGILQTGIKNQWDREGHLVLRPPWITKENDIPLQERYEAGSTEYMD